MKVLTRYLIRAHVGPFLFAFVALTGVILINTLAKELANLAGKGLPMGVVLEFFVLSLPANVALTLPMAVLVAVLYTFSTLASENEITALRASGVDLRRAALPLILLAGMIAGGMMWFNDRVLPASNYKWRVLMTDVSRTRPLLALQEQSINPIRTLDGSTPYYLEAQKIDPETGVMHQVSIYDVSDGGISRTITADSGRMAFNRQRTDLLLTLFDGHVRELDFSDGANFQIFAFQQQMMRMAGVSERLQRTAESAYRTDRDMTIGMMRERIDTLRAELQQLEANSPRAQAIRMAEARAHQADPLPGDAGSGGGVAAGTDPLPGDTGSVGGVSAGNDPMPGDTGSGGGVAAGTDPMPGDTGSVGGVAAGTDPMPGDTGSLGRSLVLALEQGTPAPVPSPGAAGMDPLVEALDDGDSMLAESQRYTEARMRNVEYQIREFQVEIQKKFSIATATLVFVLIGIPLALRFPRGGLGMVIGVSLAIFGVYYVGLIGGETLGDEGYVPPALAMWFTNFVFGTLGLLGFLRLGSEQGTTRGGGWELPAWLRFGGSRWRRAEGSA
jgi:lipopolysaccharide export system permease protein